ncbi:hypothetical protein AHAS_Ahas19G0234000 [Arachis hypogaea]
MKGTERLRNKAGHSEFLASNISSNNIKGYKRWINHGEPIISAVVGRDMDDRGGFDDIDGLLRHAFGDMANLEEGNSGLNEDAK